MADPTLHEMGAYGVSGLSLLFASWKNLSKRNEVHLDKTLEHLAKSIDELRKEFKDQLLELGREIRHLRETDVRQAEQIGSLRSGLESLEKRVNGQSDAWRAEMERLAPRKVGSS